MSEILIIGGTGFIGQNLSVRLRSEGMAHSIMSRKAETLESDQYVDYIYGNLDDPSTYQPYIENYKVIYYFSHSMGEAGDYLEREIKHAENIKKTLKESQRLIYLGGIIPEAKLSKHLSSRKKVGDILRSAQAQVIELRASIVIGEGSASYELIRYLSHRLPLLVKSDWNQSWCQPIYIQDVIDYLMASQSITITENNFIEIGGPQRITYYGLIESYCSYEELKRLKLSIPSLKKDLLVLAMDIVVPEFAAVGKSLLGSIELDTIVMDADKTKSLFPDIQTKPLAYCFEHTKNIDKATLLESAQFKQLLKQLNIELSYNHNSLFIKVAKNNDFAPLVMGIIDGLKVKIPLYGKLSIADEEDFTLISIEFNFFTQKIVNSLLYRFLN